MIDAFGWVINTYGKEMVCYHADESVAGRALVIVQPMTKADWAYTAGELGDDFQDMFLGLAEPEFPVDPLGEGGFVSWEGQDFDLAAVRPIRVGGETTHLWLALRPRAVERSEE